MTDVRESGNTLAIEAPIRSVVVMEDRAQITRKASVSLEPGTYSLVVDHLTPLVVDRSLRSSLWSNNDPYNQWARIVDVQIKRRYLAKPGQPENQREITKAIRELEDRYFESYDTSRTGFHKLQQIEGYLDGLAHEISDRLGVGKMDAESAEEIRRLFDSRSDVEKELLELEWQQEERRERLGRLAEERRLLLQPKIDYQASLSVQVEIGHPDTYTLQIQYQVPCALWRPEYTAELLEENGRSRVKWLSAGTVWQATGEEWQNVRLEFSTARPALGAELPLLQDDLLSARDKTEQERKIIEVTSRAEAIAQTTEVPREKQTDTPPGLDDGGEARTYAALELARVPSDGRPHRFEFEQWEAPAEVSLVTLPEKAELVHLRSFVDNPSAGPLLAGPVHLIRSGGYTGRSRIGYVAPGERFAISWGSEDGIVVLRRSVREFEEAELRRRKLYRYKAEIYLSNQDEAARSIQVVERIPVSEIEQVEVSLLEDDCTPGFRKNDQGLVRWDVNLAGGAETMLRLSFRVTMPNSVQWNG